MANRLPVRRLARGFGVAVAGIVIVSATITAAGSSVAGGGAPSAGSRCGDSWTGGAGTSDWGTAANWSAGVPNGTGVDACVPSGATVVIHDAAFSVRELTVSAGATLVVGVADGPRDGTGTATDSATPVSLSVSSTLQNDGTITVRPSGADAGIAIGNDPSGNNTAGNDGAGNNTASNNSAGTVTNTGTVALAPGGVFELSGSSTFTNEPGGLVAFGIGGGPATTSAYGRITGGRLSLGGTADPLFVDGFTPPPGAEYFVYSGSVGGTFATVLHGGADYSRPGEVGLTGGAPASATSTSLASPAAGGTVYSQGLQLTATVTSSGPGPTGSVSFFANGVLLGTSPATPARSGATATLDSATLGVGTNSITATYSGDVLSDPSTSSAVTHVVSPDPTSVTVTPAPASPQPGQPVTYTATVDGLDSAGGVKPGTVSFTDDGTPLEGCQSLQLPAPTSTGEPEVTCVGSRGANTTHVIVASYSGDAHDAASQGSYSETIGQIPTQTTVASSNATSTYGQSVSLTATVASSSGSVNPSGTVTFYDDDTTPLGTEPVSSKSGAATANLVTSGLTAGPHWVTATYGGDASSSASSAETPVRLDVAEVPTTVTVASSANPAAPGQDVTLTATISASLAGETGTVVFADDGSMIGTGAVSGGQATLQTSSLAPGSHSITAVYEGDDDFVGTSSTNTLDQTIAALAGATTTSVVASPASLTYGESVTLTATVTPASGTANPTGVVTFTDDGTTLGSSELSTEAGVTTSSLLVTTLPLGANSITASYGGDPGFVASSSDAAAVTVRRAPTSLGIASSDNPYVFGQPVTLFATVFPLTGFGEGGTVTFYDNGAVLGTAAVTLGQAMLTTTFHLVGTNDITASYSGEANFAGSSSTDALSEIPGS